MCVRVRECVGGGGAGGRWCRLEGAVGVGQGQRGLEEVAGHAPARLHEREVDLR